MEYIEQKLANIFESSGFKDNCEMICNRQTGTYWFKDNYGYSDEDGSYSYNPTKYLLIPSEYQIINWIFDKLGVKNDLNNQFDYECNLLEFWYTALVEHKFSLMGQFIYRLKDWFDSNGLHYNVLYVTTKKIGTGYIWEIIEYPESDDEVELCETRQDATHDAITTSFKILKNKSCYIT